MFNLDDAINQWRGEMLDAGIHSRTTLDELECHLRDAVDGEMARGVSVQDAFRTVVEKMGTPELLHSEFQKEIGLQALKDWAQQSFLTLAGIPSSSLAMNTTAPQPNAEPAWITYVKAGSFLAPALLLWGFSVVYLVPKLQHIASDAGFVMPTICSLAVFVSGHAPWIACGVALLLFLLERRFSKWARYRRACVGFSVFLLNAGILMLITAMVTLALYLAPYVSHSHSALR